MSAQRTQIHDYEISVLLNIICFGRPDAYSPQNVWDWLEEGDIESLRHCEISVFHISPSLDDIQEQGRALDRSGHNIIMPPPEFPILAKNLDRPPSVNNKTLESEYSTGEEPEGSHLF